MPFEKKLWQDRIKDAQGNIIQEGTPFSAGNMNRIEQGIYDAHQMLEKQSQQTTTIGHGLNVINASQNSPLDIQIEGRTLVNMSQNVLDTAKYYVLSDKKSKVKFSDGTTYAGVAKFQGKAEKPILIRVENFDGKVSGSTVENPHVAKVVASPTLQPPSNFVIESYGTLDRLDGVSALASNSTNGNMIQRLFSFNLIEAVERTLGKIPASDTAGKVAWLKNNVAKIICNAWLYGQSPSGYKANLSLWRTDTTSWISPVYTTNSTPTKISIGTVNVSGTPSTAMNLTIDSNGFIHFLAYAEPSDGVTASTIYTDFVELEIELLQNAQLWNPRFTLYEVDATEYANILTVWDENEVMRRYPMVEGVQHVQNPYVIVEGENLLPPFTEGWTLNQSAIIRGAYELEVNAADTTPFNSYQAPALPNTIYTASIGSISANGRFAIREVKKDGSKVFKTNITSTNLSYTFTTASDTIKIEVDCTVQTPGIISYKNPMLTVGNQAKPFVPRNPSMLFAEVKLGAIGDKKDILWKDGQDWKVTKWVEKIDLDGKLAWSFSLDATGYKQVRYAMSGFVDHSQVITKYDGKILSKYTSPSVVDMGYLYNGYLTMTISDTDSGWGENYTPTADEIKAYFNGWQAKTVDGNGKPTAWRSLVDGTDAPTQTLAYVKDNIAPGFTPYKLSYVRSTPVTEIVTDRVEGDLVINGQTQVEVGSGFTYTEVDGKRTYTKLTGNQRYNVTANILSIIANYDASLKSVVDSVVAKQSDIAANQSALIRSVAELYKRVKALGG
ncbi:hypothetical protein A3Q35_13140 [Aeribacillus pallidus]|uniref:hypothetical protein n=1 Tax=Aeribacillus pallidus TaxID=33936 RepID=UPI0007B48B5B|nr:hypothetical protein [Aeribacillus pallidus]KZM54898.1 hypothetical protein A3Q35_13140 [Aeribacillus pallidus]